MIFLQGSKVICNIHDISHEEGQLTGHTFINNVHFPRTKTMHRSDYLLYQNAPIQFEKSILLMHLPLQLNCNNDFI